MRYAQNTGDVLLVTRLDRLARSTRDLLNVMDAVTKRGAGFKIFVHANFQFRRQHRLDVYPCPYRQSNPRILVVQAAEHSSAFDAAS